MIDFISMAGRQSEIVDCRMMQLEMEFYHLQKPQLNTMASLFLHGIEELFGGSCYLSFDCDSRTVRRNVLDTRINNVSGNLSFGCTGDVISSTVYDARSFKYYDQSLRSPHMSGNFHLASTDYFPVFQKLLKTGSSPQELKEGLVRLFNQPGRKKLGFWCNHDLMCNFFGHAYHFNKSLYYGKLNLLIALPCLGVGAVAFAERLERLACDAANLVSNISGRITLSPIYPIGPCSGYMEYFGAIPDELGPKDPSYWPVEWEPYHYLQGAEWANILSPMQQMHLPQLDHDSANFQDVVVNKLSGGCILVKSRKNILETDIAELAQVKKLLYAALVPGKSEMLLNHLWNPDEISYITKPRIHWEYVPIFNDEVTILDDRIVLHHQSLADHLFVSP